jgi:hypothetical protein
MNSTSQFLKVDNNCMKTASHDADSPTRNYTYTASPVLLCDYESPKPSGDSAARLHINPHPTVPTHLPLSHKSTKYIASTRESPDRAARHGAAVPAPAQRRNGSRCSLGLTCPGVAEIEVAMASPPVDETASAISLQHPPREPPLGSEPKRATAISWWGRNNFKRAGCNLRVRKRRVRWGRFLGVARWTILECA